MKTALVKLEHAADYAKLTAKKLKGGEVLALVGPLGAGKTTFTKALAKALKVRTKVTSPTFVIMHRHYAKIRGKKIHLYHLDLYRTRGFREVSALGLEEFWNKPDTITVIEWADKIKKYWPKGVFMIKFSN